MLSVGRVRFPPDYDKILSAFRKAKTFHMNRNKKKKLDNEPAKIEVGLVCIAALPDRNRAAVEQSADSIRLSLSRWSPTVSILSLSARSLESH